MNKTSTCWSLLIALLTVACFGEPGDTEAQTVNWKIPPDPDIVNFKREDADIVTQDLVAPPFLPSHEQTASGPPKIVRIQMNIVEREVEIAPGVFVWQMAFDNSVP